MGPKSERKNILSVIFEINSDVIITVFRSQCLERSGTKSTSSVGNEVCHSEGLAS